MWFPEVDPIVLPFVSPVVVVVLVGFRPASWWSYHRSNWFLLLSNAVGFPVVCRPCLSTRGVRLGVPVPVVDPEVCRWWCPFSVVEPCWSHVRRAQWFLFRSVVEPVGS